MVPQGVALADMIVAHYEAVLGFYGTDRGLRVARKHLGWYLEAADLTAAGLPAARARIVTPTDPETVIRAVRDVFADAPGPITAPVSLAA